MDLNTRMWNVVEVLCSLLIAGTLRPFYSKTHPQDYGPYFYETKIQFVFEQLDYMAWTVTL